MMRDKGINSTQLPADSWRAALAEVAAYLHKDFQRRFPFQDDGEVSPDIVALRDAFYQFPVPADILLIEAGQLNEWGEGPTWTLMCLHLADSNKEGTVRFHGSCQLNELDNHSSTLALHFGFSDADFISSLKDLKFRWVWDQDSTNIVNLVPFDIRERPEEYARELSNELLMFHGENLIRRFKKEFNFNALYGLQQDRILSFQEIAEKDPTTAAFGNISIEERQADISGIQLIPQVPPDIVRTFTRAKYLSRISVLRVAREPSGAIRHLYLCGLERDDDTSEVH
ncbi:MAG: hypothetical protein L0338_35915, partial [Acidobacteria bacterium]|nr:hypothetical protein [Acidobacteriota bacterium]